MSTSSSACGNTSPHTLAQIHIPGSLRPSARSRSQRTSVHTPSTPMAKSLRILPETAATCRAIIPQRLNARNRATLPRRQPAPLPPPQATHPEYFSSPVRITINGEHYSAFGNILLLKDIHPEPAIISRRYTPNTSPGSKPAGKKPHGAAKRLYPPSANRKKR